MATMYNWTDVLGLAVADKVILVEPVTGGIRKDAVETINRQTGKIVQAATKMIRPREEYSCAYEMLTGADDVVLHFGVAVATSYFLTGATISMVNQQQAKVSIRFVKLTSAGLFNAANSPAFDITCPKGFGVVDLLGCTVAAGGEAIEGAIEVQTSQPGVLGATSGDFQTAGYGVFGGKLIKSLSATGVITLPTNALQATGDVRGDDIKTYAASWLEYPTYV
jgi:hypothetical protein